MLNEIEPPRLFRVSSPLGRALKRSVDIVGSGAGLMLLAPLFLVVALLIKIDSPGPVFFRQVRVGKDGTHFSIWKFRSMVDHAESSGPGVTVQGDPRITRVGGVLRARKIDELPQLLNVLGGSMSLVGPRPELPRYVRLYSPEERAILESPPGITDPASLAYVNEEELLAAAADPHRHYEDVVMRQKLEVNLAYAREATVLTDLGVILRTLWTIARRPAG
jgi:lipopolysaccharide/colanic/teichoic acid biosynthesis glycosyltransferase